MKDLIMITGASSGIGYEMAKLLAAKKYDLLLVARNEKKLETLAKELREQYGVAVHVFSKDLSLADSARELYNEVKAKELEVTMLVNNAGAGLYGKFIDTDLEAEQKMIQLNISSVVTLSKLFVQDMVVRNYGRVMNVASILSYLPFPYYAVYSATKSFVLAFTETWQAEMQGTGVVVSALVPGPVDTPFNSDEMWKTNAYKQNPPVHPRVAAQNGVDLLLSGKSKKTVGFNNWFISNLPRVTPDVIMMKIKKQLASQRTVN